MKDPHTDGRNRVIEPYGEEPVFPVIDDGEFSSITRAAHLPHTTLVEPGVTTPEVGLRRT